MDREIKTTVSEELHKELRILAAVEDKPLKQLIAELIAEAMTARN